MTYSDFAIGELKKRLLEKSMKPSTPKKCAGDMLEAYEVIVQLEKEISRLRKEKETMTLYEILDKTLCYQEVWIYENNAYDQNMPIFKGEVEDARGDTERTWNYLMCEVDHFECNTGILLVLVKTEHYNSRMEERYFHSEKWGNEKEKRPWRHSAEIAEELRDTLKKNQKKDV